VNRVVENTFRWRLGDDLYEEYAASDYPLFNGLRSLLSKEESPWFDDPRSPEVEGRTDLLARSFTEGVADLVRALGKEPDEWVWKRLHAVTFYHPMGEASAMLGRFLNVGPLPVGGGIETVNPVPWTITDPWEATYGASMRFIVDLAQPGRSRRVIPAGISGNAMSPHYRDQVELWMSGRYRPFLVTREAVERETRALTRLLPR
jgi:penicillin amidase